MDNKSPSSPPLRRSARIAALAAAKATPTPEPERLSSNSVPRRLGVKSTPASQPNAKPLNKPTVKKEDIPDTVTAAGPSKQHPRNRGTTGKEKHSSREIVIRDPKRPPTLSEQEISAMKRKAREPHDCTFKPWLQDWMKFCNDLNVNDIRPHAERIRKFHLDLKRQHSDNTCSCAPYLLVPAYFLHNLWHAAKPGTPTDPIPATLFEQVWFLQSRLLGLAAYLRIQID